MIKIKHDTLTDIADAVRERTHTKPLIPVVDIPNYIKTKIPFGIRVVCRVKSGEIIRPEGWADISKLPKEDDALYFVVDNTGRIDDTPVGIKMSGSAYTVDVGHVVNDAYVVDSSTSIASGGTYTADATTLPSGYPVLRIRTTGSFTNLDFVARTVNGHSYVARYNAIVEASGVIRSYNGGLWGAYWLEIDSRVIKALGSVTSLQYTWYCCYSLQSLDLSGWDAANWAVTSLQYTWQNCYSLQSLDLSGWDTSKFTITELARTFYFTISLTTLNLSSFPWSKIKTLYDANYTAWSLYMLQNLIIGQTNVVNPTTTIWRLEESRMLTRESILEVFNALATVTTAHTLKLGTENLNKITDAEKAIATGKGWTLA